MPRAAEFTLESARDIALQELPMWPERHRLRHSPRSTADEQIFAVLSPAGEVCGTITVNRAGSLSTRKFATRRVSIYFARLA